MIATPKELIEVMARAICRRRVVAFLERSGVMAINPARIDEAVDRDWQDYEPDALISLLAVQAKGAVMVPVEQFDHMIHTLRQHNNSHLESWANYGDSQLYEDTIAAIAATPLRVKKP